MQLNLTTDYAIRIIHYLCENGKTSSSELSNQLGISQNYIRKLMTKTALQDFVESYAGSNGGFQIKNECQTIVLRDIVEAMEGKIYINKCLESQDCCDNCMRTQEECLIREIYENMQSIVEHQFESMVFTVADDKEEAVIHVCR